MAEQNKQEVAGISLEGTNKCLADRGAPPITQETYEALVRAKQKPEPVSPEWIARAAEECAHEMLDESYKMGTTVKAKKMCHDIDIAWIGTERIKAIIQAAIERNSK